MREKGELPKNRTHRLKRRMWRKVNECQIFSRELILGLSPLIASCRCQVYLSCLDERDYRSKAHSYVYLPCRLEFKPGVCASPGSLNVPLDLWKAPTTTCFCPYLRAHAPLQGFWGFSVLFFIPSAVKERAKLCASSQRWWIISLCKVNTEFSYLL